jgi:hypothetical protein
MLKGTRPNISGGLIPTLLNLSQYYYREFRLQRELAGEEVLVETGSAFTAGMLTGTVAAVATASGLRVDRSADRPRSQPASLRMRPDYLAG